MRRQYFRLEDGEVLLALPSGPVRLNKDATALWLDLIKEGQPIEPRATSDLVAELEAVGALDDLGSIQWSELLHLSAPPHAPRS